MYLGFILRLQSHNPVQPLYMIQKQSGLIATKTETIGAIQHQHYTVYNLGATHTNISETNRNEKIWESSFLSFGQQ